MAGKKVLLVIALWYQASHKQSKNTRPLVIFCVSWILPAFCRTTLSAKSRRMLDRTVRLQSSLVAYRQKQDIRLLKPDARWLSAPEENSVDFLPALASLSTAVQIALREHLPPLYFRRL